MLPIIVAIFLALSLVGGGVVYASENAPPSSPLHPVQVVVHQTASTLHLTNLSPTSSGVSSSAAPAGPNVDGHPKDKDDAFPHPTRTPIPTALATAFATAEAEVHALATDTAVPGHSENGLDAKLDAARNALSHGNPEAAAAILDAFARQLNAMERSGHISQSDYTALRTQYLNLLTELNQTYSLTVTPIPTVGPNPHGPDQHAQPNELKGPDKHEDDDGVNAGASTGLTPTPTPELHGKGKPENGSKDRH